MLTIIFEIFLGLLIMSLVGLFLFSVILSRNARAQREAERMEDMVEKYCLRKERELGYDHIPSWDDEAAERASVIGQNGNDGLHYEDNES
tara:strand:+ start:3350 stop:3619 length:270 start_codon:yes stop_codon:yes gene_type:complete